MKNINAVAKSKDEEKTSLTAEEILSLPVDDLLSRLNTSQLGLTSKEVENRLETYGARALLGLD